MVCLPGGGVVDWLTGSLDLKFWGYERHRVRFINVVPYLINGSGYKKPGSVAQKHKLIQNSYPFTDQNDAEILPDWAAHAYITSIRECPPGFE